jgi:hypothetical protein
MKFNHPLLPALLLAVLTTLATLSGCATLDQKIALNYSPTERSFGRHDDEIHVSRAESAPSERNSKGEWIIGSINNIHGVHQADLLADRSLGDWISDALSLELKKAGYSVSCKTAMPKEAPLGIRISEINAYLNANRGLVSMETRQDLKFTVELFQAGVKTKTFAVSSRNNQTFALSASKEDKERIMLQSLQDAMLQIIPEINALTDKK